jgi:hypothetical protein
VTIVSGLMGHTRRPWDSGSGGGDPLHLKVQWRRALGAWGEAPSAAVLSRGSSEPLGSRDTSLGHDLRAHALVAVQLRCLPRRLLPPPDRHVDERRADLDRAATAAGAFGGISCEPLPLNGSNTTLPGFVCFRIGWTNSSTGFSVSWHMPTEVWNDGQPSTDRFQTSPT